MNVDEIFDDVFEFLCECGEIYKSCFTDNDFCDRCSFQVRIGEMQIFADFKRELFLTVKKGKYKVQIWVDVIKPDYLYGYDISFDENVIFHKNCSIIAPDVLRKNKDYFVKLFKDLNNMDEKSKVTFRPYTKQELIEDIMNNSRKPYVYNTIHNPDDYFIIERISNDGIYLKGNEYCYSYAECFDFIRWSDGAVMGIPKAEF